MWNLICSPNKRHCSRETGSQNPREVNPSKAMKWNLRAIVQVWWAKIMLPWQEGTETLPQPSVRQTVKRVTQRHLVNCHQLFTFIQVGDNNQFYQRFLTKENKICLWEQKQRGKTRMQRVCIFWDKLIYGKLAKKSMQSRLTRSTSDNISSCYGLSGKINFGAHVTNVPMSASVLSATPL